MRLIRWVLLVTLGEAVGFSVPAAVGVAVTAASWGPLATVLAMVLAGSVEGALLGIAQADCLYRWRVLPVRRRWVVATSIGAAVAWSLGMLPSILGGLNWTAGTIIAAAIGALILLSSLPLAQYVVLRDHVRPSARWIPINMAAWLVGIVWTLLPSPWFDQSTSTGALIFTYGIAGAVHGGDRCSDHRLGPDSALATARRSKISILSWFRARRRRTRRDFTAQEGK
jgi:hypothetical protein